MNEELETALAELIQKTLSGVDSLVGFGHEQLPDVISQLLAWNSVESFIWFCASIVPVFAWRYVPRTLRSVDDSLSQAESRMIGGAIWFPIICISLALASVNLDWLQIYIAPKVWLLEYAAGLVK